VYLLLFLLIIIIIPLSICVKRLGSGKPYCLEAGSSI